MKIDTAPLHALLLAGGHSRRMGKEKSKLLYQGQTQFSRIVVILRELGIPSHLSIRAGQTLPAEAMAAEINPIHDRDSFKDIGPLGGILSALASHPGHAFLVIACDLPFLEIKTLEQLIQDRKPEKLATAFRSHHDRLPEPLCAIWEPHGAKLLQQKLDAGIRCPRKILIQSEIQLLELTNKEALDNINTPEEYRDALARMKK
ncbi:MAG: NTP transferase domain-containing protein [Opitutae bacterium]|jgi:molybdenum cofactor guanylyltransferase|nr:NTP transferase domain-containing protein [Opitutae bacterium]MBT4223906.1 NTP transferase domain-containing protein [Opitutae bacterium]MBT5379434.1 NTP transferase domain-containing protein [Opitutae bacterium]MBT5692060.1 NTP transferase domain-containing protein [Opitutae bacterium]MBT6463470.1 NTP transferase domain-containing protein [Opitutae bacterium]